MTSRVPEDHAGAVTIAPGTRGCICASLEPGLSTLWQSHSFGGRTADQCLFAITDGVDGEDLLVPNPNRHYVPESSSEDEEEEEDDGRPRAEAK